MARPEESLNHESLSLILGLYQSLAADPKAWITTKRKAPPVRAYFRPATGRGTRPGTGRITQDVCGYRITIQCDLVPEGTKTLTLIRMSAPGWSVSLRGRDYQHTVGQVEYRVTRLKETYKTSLHFEKATVRGMDRFKHQMTLISMFADIPPVLPVRHERWLAW